ncbi:MAG: aminotransferase class I/II-fold pyridoxal phosphate-dependent enzyme [Coprococcus sp.]|nr:aminotransferase class I/II-fold pyridoxal phosphate-dependent enzyme [Coprococcus sp.]
MKYDFTTVYDRRGKDASAVDGVARVLKKGVKIKEGFDIIPMWIADMNFPVAPVINEKIAERMQHPLYGYFPTSDEYYNKIINWQKVRNHVAEISRKDIAYENGVLGGVSSALRAFCTYGDFVLVHAPAYIGFTGVLRGNGYRAIYSDLVKDENGVWRMDFEDMEKKIVENHIHAAIFCSPHNPAGRVWERWELEKMMELYKKYDVYVISDEIWSDLVLYGNKHIPLQSISEDAKNRTVAFYSLAKTFNLAGFVCAYRICYNPLLRDRIDREESVTHYNDIHVLSMHALIGAYSDEGMEWLEELNQVLGENVSYAYDYMTQNFDGVSMAKPEGTYMLYLDCSEWCNKTGKTIEDLIRAGQEVGVIWQDGRMFMKDNSIRMNLALPMSRLKEGLERLKKYVFV